MTSPRVNAPTIDTSLRLTAGQYVAEETPKSMVCLHHTVGGPATGTIRYWNEDPRRIATAYVIDRDGTTFEVFDPQYWAWHLGVKDEGLEKRSIGIELCNWGPLEIDAKRLVRAAAFPSLPKLGTVERWEAEGRLCRLAEPWRSESWRLWEQYPETQIAATIGLVGDLCERFGIPRRLPLASAWGLADLRGLYTYEGVVHHAQLRKDKSDLSPAFPMARLTYVLGDGG